MEMPYKSPAWAQLDVSADGLTTRILSFDSFAEQIALVSGVVGGGGESWSQDRSTWRLLPSSSHPMPDTNPLPPPCSTATKIQIPSSYPKPDQNPKTPSERLSIME